MVDYFALLNFPRTPWLDPAEVQARFLELSAVTHPDRVHSAGAIVQGSSSQKFSELNKAATVLRDHKERLHYLALLETGAPPSATQNIPPEFINVFSRVGQACRDIDQFLAERARSTSPMLQAQLFAKGLEWSDAAADLQKHVGTLKTKAELELQEIARGWPAEKRLDQLAILAHTFAMITKWESQLRERFAALAAV